MTERHTVDLIVIGLGPGGESLAQQLATAGRSVLAVDAHLVGGECPYYACVPTKMMLHAVREGTGWEQTEERIRAEATDGWDDTAAVGRLRQAGATVVHGHAELTGATAALTVSVTPVDGISQTWTARQAIVQDTGAESVLVPVEGLPDSLTWTHREVVTATDLPRRLAIVGGGPVGCELAQALHGFGVEVTVLLRGDRLLSDEEPQAGDLLGEVFREQGITVRTGTEIERADPAAPDGPVSLRLSDGQELSVDRVLLATGRSPRDEVEVDDLCRVLQDGRPVPGRYAIGDMTGVAPFTHVSIAQADVVARQLLGDPDASVAGVDGDTAPRVTYTHPEVAAVGLTERQAGQDAERRGWEVATATADLSGESRGWIDEVRGSLVLVADRDAGILLGATVVGPHAGEIVGALTVAVHARVPLTELARIPWAYPTLHRAIGTAAARLVDRLPG